MTVSLVVLGALIRLGSGAHASLGQAIAGSAGGQPGARYDHTRMNDVSAVDTSDVWAVGEHLTHQGGAYTTRIKHWDGSTWTVVPSPSPAGPKGESYLGGVVALDSNDVWAAGWYVTSGYHLLVQHWNGSAWRTVQVPTPAGVAGAEFDDISATSRTDVWAVGYSSTARGDEHTLAEHFDGHDWAVVPTPDIPVSDGPELFAVTAISSTSAWAVGLRDRGDSKIPLILRWNGHVWRESTAPAADEVVFLNAVSGSAPDDVWAVGSAGGKIGETVTYHWDGHRWAVVPSPHPGGMDASQLYGVVALNTHSAWAVGWDREHQQLRTLVIHWDGHRWSRVAAPGVGGPFSSLFGLCALSTHDAWAVGVSRTQEIEEHWDGHRWRMT